MKYKISDVYVKVNGENIAVGVVLGQEDQSESPFGSILVTNSEYEKGLKEFRYGKQRIDNLVYYTEGEFENFIAKRPVDQKWIDELEKMGYDVTKLQYERQVSS